MRKCAARDQAAKPSLRCCRASKWRADIAISFAADKFRWLITIEDAG